MITALRLSDDQWKLVRSIGVNFLTRVPAVIGALFFLPEAKAGLGTDNYSLVLSSIALGGAAAFVLAGFGTLARRLVGEAYGEADHVKEADAFVSFAIAGMAGACMATFGVLIYGVFARFGAEAFIIAVLSVALIYLNGFDNIRAGYNEHYATAAILTVSQISAFSIGLAVAAVMTDILLTALVLLLPNIVTSLIGTGLLIVRRPYLLRGRATSARKIATEGASIGSSDGLLMGSLNMGVLLLEAAAPAATSAWFGTVVRLFQMFLSPALLIIVPFSSYVRTRWSKWEDVRRAKVMRSCFLLSAAYGVLVALALAALSHIYVGGALNLPAPGSFWQTALIFLLLATITFYKAYTAMALMVLDLPALAMRSMTAMVGAMLLTGLASFFLSPLPLLGVFSAITAAGLLLVAMWSVRTVVDYDHAPK